MKQFPTASMDIRTTISTWTFLILMPLLCYFVSSMQSVIAFSIIIVVTPLSLIFALLLRPKYFIDEDNIIIKTSLKTIKIPRNTIIGTKFDNQTTYNVRTFGIGGVLGYFGYFNFWDLWYVTNIRMKVKIKTNRRLYVISPENPQEFLEELNKFHHNL